jgi:hypothetical protein
MPKTLAKSFNFITNVRTAFAYCVPATSSFLMNPLTTFIYFGANISQAFAYYIAAFTNIFANSLAKFAEVFAEPLATLQ